MNKDKLSGILSKIDSHAEELGGLLGILSAPMAEGRGVSVDTIRFMMDRLKGWKFTNPLEIVEALLDPATAPRYPIMDNALAALGGWAFGEFGDIIHPKVAKIGRIVKKGAIGGVIGNIIGGFLWLPAILGGTTSASGNTLAPGTTHTGMYS